MNLEALRGFLAVCRHGSFTEAADALYITQPAVSQQVKALEDELGAKLIDKKGKSIVLTPAGEEVRSGAEDVISRIERMFETVDDIKGLRKGRISIAAADTVVMYLFPKWLKRFRKKYPGIDLYLTGRMSADAEELVLRGECDLGLVTLPARSSDVASELIRTEELCLVLHPKDPLVSVKRLTLKSISEKPRIALGAGSSTRKLIEDEFAKRGIEWKPAMELNGFEMIKQFVASSHGVAIIPQIALREREGYVFRSMPASFPRQELGIIYRKEKFIGKPLKELICIMSEGQGEDVS